MPSAQSRRAKAAKKKEKTAVPPARKDSMITDVPVKTSACTVETIPEVPADISADTIETIPEVSEDTSAGTIDTVLEVPEDTWLATLNTLMENFEPEDEHYEYWSDAPIHEKDVYLAADPTSPYHSDWLKYQAAFRLKDEDNAPPSMPYEFIGESAPAAGHPLHDQWLEYQRAFDEAMSKFVPAFASAVALEVSSQAKTYGPEHSLAKDCLYWPMGTCRYGDDCWFKHDPAQAPKPRAALPNGRWR